MIAAVTVSIGVPVLLAYVYGVVPISLCRSEGCGVSTSGNGVKIDVDEETPYRPISKSWESSALLKILDWKEIENTV